jgi:DHA1 family bicyclomycin/chloramphenicol resistance-like MFS transporter
MNASERKPPSDALVAVALALFLGLQPVTTDLYLPGLPALSAEFGGAVGLAQLTLSGLILAFGFGQLLLGPVSDRFGRRPVLLAGLGLYVLGSISSAHATSMDMLIFGRVLQGIGLAASVVCGRAMVRDLYDPLRGTLVMSRAQSGLGLFALGSPILGGVLAATLGWRAAPSPQDYIHFTTHKARTCAPQIARKYYLKSIESCDQIFYRC